VTINGVQLRNNSTGILVDASLGIANVTVRDTVAASSNNHGMSVTTSGPHAGAIIDHDTFLYKGGDGLKVNGPGAIAIISSSTISGNLNLGVEATPGGATLL